MKTEARAKTDPAGQSGTAPVSSVTGSHVSRELRIEGALEPTRVLGEALAVDTDDRVALGGEEVRYCRSRSFMATVDWSRRSAVVVMRAMCADRAAPLPSRDW
jgi:hypothetical protein